MDGITPLVVPNASFYRIDTSLLTPRLDVATWSLTVDGMVDHPFTRRPTTSCWRCRWSSST